VIIDTSAIVAVLRREPESEAFSALMLQRPSRLSAAGYLETAIVLDRSRQPVVTRALDDLLRATRTVVEPVTAEHARIAREAYRDYGRGSGHPARLNFGDCFSYALARCTGEPLLYKGDDFVHTELPAAAERS
jgi:ribonuclease VapC